MDSLNDFLSTTEADILAISTDYRPIFVAEMRAIVAAEFSGQGFADTEARELARDEFVALLEEARRYFPLGNIAKLEKALEDFRRGLGKRVAERQADARKRGSFASQIERCIARDEFRHFAYGRAETLALESLCADGDEILSIDFDYITVERDGIQRQITRRELIKATMPGTSSFESWRRAGGFVSDSKIKERREIAEKAAYNAEHPDSGRRIIRPDGSWVRA